MEGILITWRELLIGLALVALFYALQSLFLFLRRRQSSDAAIPAQHDRELAPLHNELAAVRMRLDAIEHYLIRGEGVTEAVQVEPVEEEDATAPYGQAMLMARDGMDADELAERCGISLSEASLIIAMQRQKQS